MRTPNKTQQVKYNQVVRVTAPDALIYVQATVKRGKVRLTVIAPPEVIVSDPLPLTVVGELVEPEAVETT